MLTNEQIQLVDMRERLGLLFAQHAALCEKPPTLQRNAHLKKLQAWIWQVEFGIETLNKKYTKNQSQVRCASDNECPF